MHGFKIMGKIDSYHGSGFGTISLMHLWRYFISNVDEFFFPHVT